MESSKSSIYERKAILNRNIIDRKIASKIDDVFALLLNSEPSHADTRAITIMGMLRPLFLNLSILVLRDKNISVEKYDLMDCLHLLKQDQIIPFYLFKEIREKARAWFNPALHGSDVIPSPEQIEDCIGLFFDYLEMCYFRSPHGLNRGNIYLTVNENFNHLQNHSEKFTLVTVNALRGAGKGKYVDELFLEPSGWKDLLLPFCGDHRPVLVLTGSSGHGKSCLLCHTALVLTANHHPVLLFNKSNLPQYGFGLRDTDLEGAIFSILGGGSGGTSTGRIDGLLRLTEKKEKTLFLIFDGLNEYENSLKVCSDILNFAGRIYAQGLGHVLKIVLSIRDSARHNYQDNLEQCSEYLYPDPLTSFDLLGRTEKCFVRIPLPDPCDLYEKYRANFGRGRQWHELSDQVHDLLKEPFMMRLLFENIDRMPKNQRWNEDVLHELNTGTERFLKYNPKMGRSIRRLLKLAAELKFSRPDFTFDDLEQWLSETGRLELKFLDECYQALLETGFFIADRTDRVNFTHEKTLEYLVSRFFIISKDSKREDFFREVGAQGSDRVWLVNAFKKYLRFVIESDSEKEIVAAVLDQAGEIGRDAVGLLLSDFEASGDSEKADSLLSCIESAPAHIQVRIFEVAKNVDTLASHTIEMKRIAHLGHRYEEALRRTHAAPHRIAEALIWLSDVYYNRTDDYEAAITLLNQAIEMEPDERRAHEMRYFLARVLSDHGSRIEAERQTEIMKEFYMSHRGEEYRQGLARYYFLVYMLFGDASGRFARHEKDLVMGMYLFKEMKDENAYARCLVNKAISDLFTIDPVESALKKAIFGCDEAIRTCSKIGDIQALSYAHVNKASFLIEMAFYARDEGQSIEQIVSEAKIELSRAKELNAIMSELFVENMICANEAMMAWVVGDIESARQLLRMLHQKSNDDFFNEIDADMNLLFIDDSRPLEERLADLDGFIKRAQEKDYRQCILRGYWYKWILKKKEGMEDPSLEKSAINYAAVHDLDWGRDYRRAIYAPWYAGIFV